MQGRGGEGSNAFPLFSKSKLGNATKGICGRVVRTAGLMTIEQGKYNGTAGE